MANNILNFRNKKLDKGSRDRAKRRVISFYIRDLEFIADVIERAVQDLDEAVGDSKEAIDMIKVLKHKHVSIQEKLAVMYTEFDILSGEELDLW